MGGTPAERIASLVDQGMALRAEAADRIEALEREVEQWAKTASADPDAAIALTGRLHFRAMDAESERDKLRAAPKEMENE
jgi:hypothetical protein